MSDKIFGKYSLIPLGSLLLPIALHSVHMLLPLLMAGSASLNSGHSTHHQGPNGPLPYITTPWFTNMLSLLTILSALFTLWYLIRLWTNKTCSRRWAWIYTCLSIVSFGLLAVL